PAEPAPEPEPTPEPEPAAEPAPVEIPDMPGLSDDPNAKMDPDDIAALFAAVNGANDAAAEEAPAAETPAEPEPEPAAEPAPVEIPDMPGLSDDPNAKMDPDDIAALFDAVNNANDAGAEETSSDETGASEETAPSEDAAPQEDDSNPSMSQQEIAAMLYGEEFPAGEAPASEGDAAAEIDALMSEIMNGDEAPAEEAQPAAEPAPEPAPAPEEATGTDEGISEEEAAIAAMFGEGLGDEAAETVEESPEDIEERKEKKSLFSIFKRKKKKKNEEEDALDELAEIPEKKESIIRRIIRALFESVEDMEEAEAAEKAAAANDADALASLSDENQKILEELDEKPKEEEAGKKKKKEKKKKEKKEKPKKEKAKKPKKEKPKKPKKEKPPGPPVKRIPAKRFVLAFAFAITLGVLLSMPTILLPDSNAISDAQAAYARGDYGTAYQLYYGKRLSGEDMTRFQQSWLVYTMERYQSAFQSYIKAGRPTDGLNTLLKGIQAYDAIYETAGVYNVQPRIDQYYSNIEYFLEDQYGLTMDQARELIAIEDPYEYTKALQDITGSEK
ncbi:MAG: hypothetical protein II800_05835, partial [Lachnospiraceae bacterium]|nr:hypothetical protein [Lachnospiraceae bacterium]